MSESEFEEVELKHIRFLLNKKEKTASVISITQFSKEIPRNIICDLEEYMVTSISAHSASKKEVNKIEFADNSEVQRIETESFLNILNFTIPPKCIELEKNWCSLNCFITMKINVLPGNPRYSLYNEAMIIGKTKLDQENYDSLVYLFNRDKEIKIPYFIENNQIIALVRRMYSTIWFPQDSYLRIIEEEAFCQAKIDHLSIPAKCTELSKGWLNGSQLITVDINPNNPRYSSYNENLIIGKSKIDQENYDTLIFCNRNAEKITVPNFIEIIDQSCFAGCNKIQEIIFESNSKLKIIDKFAFSDSSIKFIAIPSSVTKICEGSFQFTKCLEKVEFSDDSKLEIIEKNAFLKSNISSISIPSSVTIIGESAFEDCNKIEDVNIPKNSELRTIGKNAFANTYFSTIFIPSKCTEIEECSLFSSNNKTITIEISSKNPKYTIFNGNLVLGKTSIERPCYDMIVYSFNRIESITIPDSTEVISPCAFHSQNFLRKVEFSSDSKLRIIGEKAFFNTSIHSICIPKTVTIIGDQAFYEIICLNSVIIPNDSQLQIIGSKAFKKVPITTISIPSSCVKIGEKCFSKCKIKTVDIQDDSNLQLIENGAFRKNSITSIKIPKHVKSIGECAFSDNSKLQVVEFAKDSELQIIKKSAFTGAQISTILLPSSVTKICSHAFSTCYNLKKFVIGEDSELRTIEDYAFMAAKINYLYIPSKCVNLYDESFAELKFIKNISVSPYNQRYKLLDNKLIIGKSLINNNKNFDSLLFCANVKTVTLPSSIESIRDGFFRDLSKLENVIIPADSKLKKIGKAVFLATSVTSFYYPSHLNEIGENQFRHCKTIKIVEINVPLSEDFIIKKMMVDCRGVIVMIPSNLLKL